MPLALAMEVVNADGHLGNRVQFLHGPALVIQGADVLPRIGGGIKKGRCKDDILVARGDAHKPEGNGIKRFAGPALPVTNGLKLYHFFLGRGGFRGED